MVCRDQRWPARPRSIPDERQWQWFRWGGDSLTRYGHIEFPSCVHFIDELLARQIDHQSNKSTRLSIHLLKAPPPLLIYCWPSWWSCFLLIFLFSSFFFLARLSFHTIDSAQQRQLLDLFHYMYMYGTSFLGFSFKKKKSRILIGLKKNYSIRLLGDYGNN